MPKPADAVTTQTICSGESFSWNTRLYNYQAGTRIAKDGCTADQVLNLTVTPKPADAVTTQTICSESLSGMVLIIQLPSWYRIAKDGCTADQGTKLDCSPSRYTTICSKLSLEWY
jgi:hypothetical protein